MRDEWNKRKRLCLVPRRDSTPITTVMDRKTTVKSSGTVKRRRDGEEAPFRVKALKPERETRGNKGRVGGNSSGA